MDTILPFALLCFTSFFTLTNPLGTMPVFLTMTHGMTDKERQSVVSRATLVAFITIMVFTFAGQFLFKPSIPLSFILANAYSPGGIPIAFASAPRVI